MSSTLAGKVAIITGGSKGIGAAATAAFVHEGARVMINYNSDSSAAQKVVSTLGKDNVDSIQADAGTVEGVTSIVDATIARFGRIDIVVANAGLLLMRDLASTTPEDFQKIYAVNVMGPYFLAQKAVPHMLKNKPANGSDEPAGGRIIFISTSVTKNSMPSPDYLLYNSTKGSIEQITRVLARGLGEHRITVNAVAPGPTATDLFVKTKTDEELKTIANMNPQKRLGEPEDIADVLAYLASDSSKWISGHTLVANGGFAV